MTPMQLMAQKHSLLKELDKVEGELDKLLVAALYKLEVLDPPAKPAKTKAGRSPNNRRQGPQPPKYQDVKTGKTWNGFGPAPAWLKNVKNRDKFLIAAE